MQALLDGTFISKLELADTFPMRDTLLKANRWLNGFYHSSAGDDNILVLDGNTGAEQGGESLARQEYEKTGQTLENEPQPSQETSGDAEITNRETGAETAAPETATGETSGEAHTEPTPEPTEEDSVPELDNPDISEAQYAGNVVIVGDRAMEIPTATNSVIESGTQRPSMLWRMRWAVMCGPSVWSRRTAASFIRPRACIRDSIPRRT